MSSFRPGAVVTAAPGREANLSRVVNCLLETTVEQIVVVYDGWRPEPGTVNIDVTPVYIDKHQPGMEQPRNVGARALYDDLNYVWFVDSDLVFDPQILDEYASALVLEHDRILIGPYDWMAPGDVSPGGQLEMDDPRWASFNANDKFTIFSHDLGAGLACFGGNLVWPRKEFEKIGGFHPALSHGRVEDGELGLRACEAGVLMSLVKEARAYHVWHPRNTQWILETNAREVPMLNAWHPWVESEGLTVADADGKRFNFLCPQCGSEISSLEYWAHMGGHRVSGS